MKNFILLLLLFSFTIVSSAQDLQISFNVSTYQGGSNISCNGAADGWINVMILGGVQPYFFHWSNGSYVQNLTGLTAGNYTIIVTDANNLTASQMITLRQPNTLSVELIPKIYDGGYNISSQGGSDGGIEAEVRGGTIDYSYLWNNGSTNDKINELTAGSYSVVITDMNGCTINSSKTLTEPSALHVVSISSPLHNGYNVSCNEGRDGAINLSATGGAPPYAYQWNNGSREQNITNLYAGHYSVVIMDASGGIVTAQIDLSQPMSLRISDITQYIYPNNYHLSCSTCSNGKLTVNAAGGVLPMTYKWKQGSTTNPLTSIGAGIYYVTVTDANGCNASASQGITPPPPDDWSLFGNINSDPTTQYLGTSDRKPLIFRTNNIERLRIDSNGSSVFNSAVTIDNLTLTQPLRVETLKVKRIMAEDGDSIIHIGLASLNFNQNTNNLWCDPTPNGLLKGIGIGDLSYGIGLYACSFGKSARAEVNSTVAIGQYVKARAVGSFVIGSGFGTATLDNTITNTIMIGTNSQVPTMFFSASTTSSGTGNVGIGGTTNPVDKLQIDKGDVLIRGVNNFITNNDEAILKLGASNNYLKSVKNYGVKIGVTNFPNIVRISSTKGVVGINIDPDVALASNTTNYKLLVGGSIGATELWVSLGTPWPDFVFDSGHKMKSLKEIKNFITLNKHLPDMPSANEITSNGSYNIGEIQSKSVKEIEELYLHIIQLNDRLEALEKDNALLKSRLQK